ncbi:SH3 domain-containing protein [Ekhidna sp.]
MNKISPTVALLLLFSACQSNVSNESGTEPVEMVEKSAEKTEDKPSEKDTQEQQEELAPEPFAFQFAIVEDDHVVLREDPVTSTAFVDNLDYGETLEVIDQVFVESKTWYKVKSDSSSLSGWVPEGALSLFLERPEPIEYYLDLFGGGFEREEVDYAEQYKKKGLTTIFQYGDSVSRDASLSLDYDDMTGLITIKVVIDGDLEPTYDGTMVYRTAGKTVDFMFEEYDDYVSSYSAGNYLLVRYRPYVPSSWVRIYHIGKREMIENSPVFHGDLVTPKQRIPYTNSLVLSRKEVREGAKMNVKEQGEEVYVTISYPEDASRSPKTYVLKNDSFLLMNQPTGS